VDWQKDDMDRETTFSYTPTATGVTALITDPMNNETQDVYQYGVLVSQTKGYGSSVAATTTYLNDPATGQPVQVTDPNGQVVATSYDSHGNPLAVTVDPGSSPHLNRTTYATYNSFNEPLTQTDGNGVTATYSYSADGDLTSVSRPLTGTSQTQTTTYTYGNSTYPGDVTSMTDPDGKITYYGYDSDGNRVETKDPLGNVTASVFNGDGWPTASYTPKAGCTWNSTPPTGCSSSYETQYQYNPFGEATKTTDPLGDVTKSTYDANGNRLTFQDGNQSGSTCATTGSSRECTAYVYDYDNELTTTYRADGTTLVTDYNADGTVADQKDGLGNKIISYGYNALAQVTSTTDALNNVTSYTLDGVGNILTKEDPVSGATCTGTKVGCTTYTYDAANELKTVSYSDTPSENVTSITYDSDGQRTGMTDGTGSSSWSYDSLNRLTGYTNGNGATVSYGYTYGSGPTYDLKDQVRSITYPNSVGTVTQSWNDDGTLASVEDWNSKTVTFGYDADANLHTITDPSTTNVTDTFGYNDADQMTSVSDSNGSTLFSATYGRDSDGQLTSDSSQASNQADYQYTGLNQLCYAGSSNSSACSSPPSNSYPYAFSAADNLTTMENAAHTGTNTQQFNNADELCWTVSGSSSNACGTAPTGATSFGYDNKGNRTSAVPSSGSATCDSYDQANRLTSIKTGTGSSCTSPTTVGTYAYDGDGLRESKTVSGTTTQFTWDGVGGNLLQQDAGGTITSFIYGPGGLPVEQIAGSTTTYLHHDQIGSTRLITDSAGATGTATTITYDPYGNPVSTSGSLTTPLMFSGQYVDSESGLYYLRARYYDPATAQFLTSDPDMGLTMSPYAYALGSPLNLADPSGLCAWYDAPCLATAAANAAVHAGTSAAGAVGGAVKSGWNATGGQVVNAAQHACVRNPFGGDNGNGGCQTVLSTSQGATALVVTGGIGLTIATAGAAAPEAIGADEAAAAAPDFIVDSNGTTIAVPEGATGPIPSLNGQGIQFTGGAGGGCLDDSVAGVRIMDSNDLNPNGYYSYFNDSGQTVDPYTGRTLSPSDSGWHRSW